MNTYCSYEYFLIPMNSPILTSRCSDLHWQYLGKFENIANSASAEYCTVFLWQRQRHRLKLLKDMGCIFENDMSQGYQIWWRRCSNKDKDKDKDAPMLMPRLTSFSMENAESTLFTLSILEIYSCFVEYLRNLVSQASFLRLPEQWIFHVELWHSVKCSMHQKTSFH